jgi:hypothetical protein
MGGGGLAPHIRNSCTRFRLLVSITLQPSYPDKLPQVRSAQMFVYTPRSVESVECCEIEKSMRRNIGIVWDLVSCSLYVNRRFGWKHHLHLHGRQSAKQDTIVQQSAMHVGSRTDYTSLHPRRCQEKVNSMTVIPQANYTDWATATCRRNFVPTFVDRGVSRGQCGGSPTVVNLISLDRSRYFSFK